MELVSPLATAGLDLPEEAVSVIAIDNARPRLSVVIIFVASRLSSHYNLLLPCDSEFSSSAGPGSLSGRFELFSSSGSSNFCTIPFLGVGGCSVTSEERK